MVHQTIATKISRASPASRKIHIKPMMVKTLRLLHAIVERRRTADFGHYQPFALAMPLFALLIAAFLLAACSSGPTTGLNRAEGGRVNAGGGEPSGQLDLSAWDKNPLPPPREQANSRWVAVRWQELPGGAAPSVGGTAPSPGATGPSVLQVADAEFWPVWVRNCERPPAAFKPLCPEIKRLSAASVEDRTRWVLSHFQPYRVEPLAGQSQNQNQSQGQGQGLLTAYYEPVLAARRLPGEGFSVPLYQLPTPSSSPSPPHFTAQSPWFTRQQIETLPEAKAALRGREIAYLADPVQALVLHIQGSGQLQITEPDGRLQTVRLAFAGTNGQPYQSIGRWLLDQGLIQDASWPGIRQWLSKNPQRSQELFWKNPRYVFFKEQKLPTSQPEAGFGGPIGAQGLPLTAGRSIAVDPRSIPYGTPAWLVSKGPTVNLQKWVFAQDTGSAIQGAVRADYFAGSGDSAGELAGRLKQPLALWVLWPHTMPG